jgi:hypothetical protein
VLGTVEGRIGATQQQFGRNNCLGGLGGQMFIDGKCHCGNVAFVLDWPGEPFDLVARVCSCSFCIKHGGVWTANPQAKLSVILQRISAVSKYAFGTETAAFYVCARCGAVPFVTSEIANHVYAVVNVNTFENFDLSRLSRQAVSFDGEDEESRLARRQRNWIADVRMAERGA